MCASALKQYHIRSVYFGCTNDRFGGTGGVLSLHSESVSIRTSGSKWRIATNIYSPSIDPPYPVYGGLFQKEAIMLLRRFYIQENEKGGRSLQTSRSVLTLCLAPNPRPKKNRELNTSFGDEKELPSIS